MSLLYKIEDNKMSGLQSLRSEIMQQSQLMGSRRRFGLFSQPVSTAVGDNSPFKIKEHPKNQMGKPVTLPRNIYASPIRSGRLSKSYFAPLNSLATHEKHDIFIQEGIRLVKEQHHSFNSGRKESNFVPPNGVITITSIADSAYPFVHQNNPELNPRRFRQEDGRVKSNPRNFYTNPDSRIIDSLFKHYPHVPDPYERKHNLELERMKKQKIKQKQDPFKPNKFTPQLLNKSSNVYGSDATFTKKEVVEVNNSYKHESPWRPNSFQKKSYQGLFQPVHKYIECPSPLRRSRQISKPDKEGFKGMGVSVLSTPSPSISLNKVNIMRGLNRSISPKR